MSTRQTALIPGRVEIHTASICARGGVDLTITVPEEIGKKSLGELDSPEGMRAVARALFEAADATNGLPDERCPECGHVVPIVQCRELEDLRWARHTLSGNLDRNDGPECENSGDVWEDPRTTS